MRRETRETESLPPSHDPGLRFVAPSARPREAGWAAAEVLDRCGLPHRLDRPMALAFLAHDEYDSHRSFFEGVRCVPPRVEITRGGDGALATLLGPAPVPARLDFPAAVKAVRGTIDEVVARAVEPHGCVAVWLSGGVDSLSVAAAAARIWKGLSRGLERLLLYHWCLEPGHAETARARAAARHLACPLVDVSWPEGDPLDGAVPLLERLDFPPDDLGASFALSLARRMRSDGVTLFFTGDGGDELFGVLSRPRARGRLGALLPRGVRDALRGRLAARRLPPGLIASARHVHPLENLPPARPGLHGEAARRDRLVRCARQACIVSWLRELAATSGLEARTPLLDSRIADLSVSLPPGHHRRGGTDKALLRAALDPRLAGIAGAPGKDQPRVEPRVKGAFGRYGPAWRERHLEGGRLEQMGLVPRGVAGAVMDRAARGDTGALYRGVCLLALELWSTARDLA